MKEGGGVTLSPRETKEESLRWSSLEKEVVGGVLSTPGDKEWTGRGAGSGCEGLAVRAQTGGLQA